MGNLKYAGVVTKSVAKEPESSNVALSNAVGSPPPVPSELFLQPLRGATQETPTAKEQGVAEVPGSFPESLKGLGDENKTQDVKKIDNEIKKGSDSNTTGRRKGMFVNFRNRI